MAQVKTNNISLQYARESSLGVLPGSPVWRLLEPNDITNYGAELGKVSRSPISKNRQRKKGAVTDLDSSTTFEADLTFDHLEDFVESFLFAQFVGGARFGPMSTNDVTAVTTTYYTVAAGGALADNTMIYARGFSVAGNNGLKVCAGTSTATQIKCAGLAAEAVPPTNATVEVAGWQGVSGEIGMDASGNLTGSGASDFTTMGLTVGQFIWVGGETAGTQFATTAYRGYARIKTIAAALLTLEKRSWTVGAADNGAGKTIRIYFGHYARNVAVGATDYIERSFQFEGGYPDLGGVGTPMYEYSLGNISNEMAIKVEGQTKATATFSFIGTNVEVPTITRKTGGSTPISPIMTTALNTTSDIARLRVTEQDGPPETVITTYFKTCNLTVNNNVGPEKVIGLLGAAFVNIGNLEVDIDAQVLFSSDAVLSAIRNNRTLTMELIARNGDGSAVFDIPSMTLSGGNKEYPLNETVKVNLTGEAHEDTTLGTSLSVSVFPYAPAA